MLITGCNHNTQINNEQTEVINSTTENVKESEPIKNTIESTTHLETTESTETTESKNETETTIYSEEILDNEQTEPEEDIVYETTETTEATEATEEAVDEYLYLINLGEFRLTAYCSCEICCGNFALNRPIDENGEEIVYGSIGVRLKEGVSIAVDPNVIKYGSKVVIGDHTYIAQDTGAAIVGNRIDIYFEDHQRASDFGTQYRIVYLVQE